MGQKLVAAARALGILLVVWGIVLVIAYFADAIPPGMGESAEAEPDPETSDATESAASEEHATVEPAEHATGEPSPEEPATDTEAATETETEAEAGEAPSGPPIAPRRHTLVCEDAEYARLGVGSIVGDDDPEQIVICGREAQVLSVYGGELARLATLRLEGDSQVRMAAPVVTDVNADGLNDLVLGWTFLDGEGGPDGGTLRWVAGDPSGGFGESHVLQPLSVVDLTTAEIDGRPGADLVALHWADGFGRRPSEAWVFGGGPSPRRLARRRLRHDGVAAQVADVDGDGNLDLVTIDAEGAQIADGDGSGRFPRFHSIPLEAGRAIVSIPAPPASGTPDPSMEDGESGDATETEPPTETAEPVARPDRIYLIGTAVVTLDAAGEPTTFPAPHGILRALGLPNGELLAMTRQRIVRVGEGTDRTVVDLPGTFRPADIALLPGEDETVLLILGRTTDGWELIEAPIGASTVRLEPGAEPSTVTEAPLVLNLALR